MDLKRGWTGIKIANMEKDHRFIPVCNDDKQYDSGKELYYFNFPRNKKKRKRMPSLEYNIYLEYIVYGRSASFQIQNGGCVIRVYGWEVLRTFQDY